MAGDITVTVIATGFRTLDDNPQSKSSSGDRGSGKSSGSDVSVYMMYILYNI